MRWTRTLGFGFLGLAIGGMAMAFGPPPLWRGRPTGLESKDSAGDDSFRRTVRPVLGRRCKPCHEPGGVMYGRIPFDDPKAVRDHRDGILRRLKAPEEREPILAWLGAEH